jgi:hypothetical protein
VASSDTFLARSRKTVGRRAAYISAREKLAARSLSVRTRAALREMAATCIEVAQTLSDETMRSMMLDMAAAWLHEAGDAPRLPCLLDVSSLEVDGKLQ